MKRECSASIVKIGLRFITWSLNSRSDKENKSCLLLLNFRAVESGSNESIAFQLTKNKVSEEQRPDPVGHTCRSLWEEFQAVIWDGDKKQ